MNGPTAALSYRAGVPAAGRPSRAASAITGGSRPEQVHANAAASGVKHRFEL